MLKKSFVKAVMYETAVMLRGLGTACAAVAAPAMLYSALTADDTSGLERSYGLAGGIIFAVGGTGAHMAGRRLMRASDSNKPTPATAPSPAAE